jgi:hypothetical protein
MNLRHLFSMLIVLFIPFFSYAEKYEVASEVWSFALITETCSDQLAQAISEITLPASTIITYPETMGDQYFKLQFQLPGQSELSVYEFEYWTENDEHLVCERIEPVDWVY